MTPIFAELAADQAAKNGTDDNYNLSDFPLVVISAINAIGVCYYVRISARVEYLDLIAPYFRLVRRFVFFFKVKLEVVLSLEILCSSLIIFLRCTPNS